MTNTLEAPRLMGGRDQVTELLSSLPSDLNGTALAVHFEPSAMSTPSFVDELVRVVLIDRNASDLTLVNISERVCEIATEAAAHFGVRERLHCELAS